MQMNRPEGCDYSYMYVHVHVHIFFMYMHVSIEAKLSSLCHVHFMHLGCVEKVHAPSRVWKGTIGEE